MNPFRAKKIADYFDGIGVFDINNKLHGIEVSYQGRQVYFEDESAFWAFLSYLAHAVHHEGLVAEAEARLIA